MPRPPLHARPVGPALRASRRPPGSATVLLVAALALVASVLATASPAQARDRWDQPTIVGLGDSYASGVGAGDYDPDSGGCRQSRRGWQRIVTVHGRGTAGSKPNFRQLSCSGAVTDDVRFRQIPSMPSDTDIVMISAGGNDALFADFFRKCLFTREACLTLPLENEDKKLVLGAPLKKTLPAHISTTVAERISRTLHDISRKAPHAQISWMGYPQLLGDPATEDKSCPVADLAAPNVREFTAEMVRLLNSVTRDAIEQARKQGIDATYIDTVRKFTGHSACTDADKSWIVRDKPLSEVIHPNPAGQRAYADVLAPYLDRSRVIYGHTVKGAIYRSYYAQDGPHGAYSLPQDSERNSKLGNGVNQPFVGGLFFFKRGAAHAYGVRGTILARYKASTYERGKLGYPTGNARASKAGNGSNQPFEHGLIFAKKGKSAAYQVTGTILGRYKANSYERGTLGYPTGNERCGLPRSGCAQIFEGGIIYDSPSTNAHAVTGKIRSFYAKHGHQDGQVSPGVRVGYPKGEERKCNSGRIQEFQGAAIFWSKATGAQWALGADC